MKFKNHTVINFVMDEEFQQWVKNPDAASNAFWKNWLTEHPAKEIIIKKARLIILSVDYQKISHSNINCLGMWQKIEEGMRNKPVQTEVDIQKKSTIKKLFHEWHRVAAMLAFLVVLGAAVFFILPKAQIISYTTPYGEQQLIKLPDGSTVTLNANSTLKFNSEWSKEKSREVWLEGEAFFNVVKKPLQLSATGKKNTSSASKFVVHTSNLHIEVLGTTFNVNDRRGKTRVVLNSGKVSLYQTQAEETTGVVMEPAELAEYSQAKHTLVKKKVNPEQYSAWTNKRLIFKETSLLEIAHVLEDNYGWEVTFENATIANRKFTGAVSTDNIDLLLTAISESFQLDVIRTIHKVHIKKKEPA